MRKRSNTEHPANPHKYWKKILVFFILILAGLMTSQEGAATAQSFCATMTQACTNNQSTRLINSCVELTDGILATCAIVPDGPPTLNYASACSAAGGAAQRVAIGTIVAFTCRKTAGL